MLEATCPFCYLRLYAEDQAELAELICPGCGKHAGHRALDVKDHSPAENAAPAAQPQAPAPRDLLDSTARLQALLQSQAAAGDPSNPYASPPQLAEFGAADIAMVSGGFHDLADLSTRFVGGLIDTGIYFIAACLGLLAAFAIAEMQSVRIDELEGLLLPIAVMTPVVPVLIAQWVLISTTAQSFGKRAMNMRIVRHSDGAPIGFVRGVLLRSIVSRVLMRLMCRLGSLIDVLVIFTSDRRCLHDYIAGTVVVRVPEQIALERETKRE